MVTGSVTPASGLDQGVMIQTAVSERIKSVSLLAIFLVIVQHWSYGISLDRSLDRLWYYGIGFSFCDWPVSFFMIVSGFFLGKKACEGEGWWLRETFKRIRSLLVPYVIWCLIAVIGGKWLLHGEKIAWLYDMGITVITPYNGAMWYVKTLFLFCLIAPVLVTVSRLVVRFKCCGGVVFAGIYLLALFLPMRSVQVFALFYFLLGMIIAQGGFSRIADWMGKRYVAVVIAFLLVHVGGCVYSLISNVQPGWYRFSLTPFAIAAVWFCPLYGTGPGGRTLTGRVSFLHYARKRTFFIYCSQAIVQMVLADFVCSGGRAELAALMALVTLCMCVVAAFAIEKTMPPVMDLLCGGRVK